MNKLKLAASLFVDLADKDVRYVHWKSNEHLDAALRGETDLDLLIDCGPTWMLFLTAVVIDTTSSRCIVPRSRE